MILRLVTLLTVLLGPCLANSLALSDSAQLQAPFANLVDHRYREGTEKVNITLYVMSRCPDARLCEQVFEDVLETSGILDKVDLNLNYIAKPNKTSPYGLECKHGALECVGNAHQLCLQQHLPLSTFYPIISCMNYPTPFPGDIGKLKFTKQCTEIHDVDWWGSGIGECIQGPKKDDDESFDLEEGEDPKLGKEGRKLLWESVKRTKEAGVTTSCTIHIESTLKHDKLRVCQVDDGVWTGCDDGHTAADFVRVIEEEYANLKK